MRNKEKMAKMAEMAKKTMEESNMKWADYYDSVCFYYLAGMYPDLSISECVDLVDMIRDML